MRLPSARYAYTFVELLVPASKIPPALAVERWARGVLARHGLRVVARAVHPFKNPAGEGHAYTLALVLASSHFVVHTAPEAGWIHVALATCGEESRAALVEEIVRHFGPEYHRVHHTTGGLAP